MSNPPVDIGTGASGLAAIRAAAIAGIDKFISKAKREQRQAIEIAAWNAEVEAKKRAKKAAKGARK